LGNEYDKPNRLAFLIYRLALREYFHHNVACEFVSPLWTKVFTFPIIVLQ